MLSSTTFFYKGIDFSLDPLTLFLWIKIDGYVTKGFDYLISQFKQFLRLKGSSNTVCTILRRRVNPNP